MRYPLLLLVYFMYTFMNHCSAEQVTDDSLFQMSDHSKDIMGYDGALICPNRTHFCAIVYYIESEFQPLKLSYSDEDLKMVGLQCTDNGVLHHNAHVVMRGGHGLFSKHYEPQITVYHDCWGGEKCHRCINQLRRAQAYLRPVPKKVFWKRQAWSLTLDPLGHHLQNSDFVEPLRPHYFPHQDTSNEDLNDWLRGREVFDRKHLLQDDSFRFEKEIPHFNLELLRD